MKPATKIPFYPAFRLSFILRGIVVCLLVFFNSRFSVFSQYSETLYGIDKGLTHSTVLDIDEDEDGFIWVFTSFGLCRFDGFRFKEYTVDFHNYERTIPFHGRILKDSKKRLWVDSALPNILISDIEHDRINVAIQIAYHDFYDIEDDGFGNYLFASIFSILRLREEQNSTFSYRELMVPDNAGSVNSLCRLEDGTIIATGQNGFFKLTITEDSIRADEIRLTREERYLKYLISDSTRILIAHDQLFLIQRQEILMTNISPSGYSDDSVYSAEPLNLDFPEIGLSNGLPVFAVIEGRKDELFIRNLNGIYSYNIKNKTAERIKEESYGSADWSEGDFRQALYYSSEDILWAGTDQGLLKIVTANKTFHSILPEPGNPHGLKVAKTRNVMIDSKGDLWLGSTSGGLFHSKQEADGSYRKFQNFVADSTNPNSLNIDHVSALFEDSQNRLWVGTDEIQWMDIHKPGIFYYAMGVPFSGNIRTVITVDDFLEDTIGNILATCIGGITWLFSPDIETAHVILLDSTRQLVFDNMLFTKTKELYLYENCHFYKLKLPWAYKLCDGSDPRNPLFRAYNDPRIRDYIPIPYVNPGEFEDLFNLDSLHALVERFIIAERDSKKTLWLTVTALKKVLRIDLDKVENEYHEGKEITHSGFKLFPAEEEGFIQTFKIIEDKNGIIWCAGNEGLLRIDPYTEESLYFYKDDGLPTDKFYWGGCKRDDGMIYLCTTNGLLYFHPDSISPDPPPRLVLTELKLFHENVKPDSGSVLEKAISKIQSLTLNHKQNFVGIGFTAPEYRNTERIRFRYKLEGLDEDWIKADQNRLAEYPNLSPGRYTFRVIASNGNGVWNTVGASLPVRILPPLWFRWWAILIEAMALVLLLIFYIRYRERELRQRAILLEEKVDEKTREILEQRKEVDEMKSRFYTNISHEFRTPLTLLVGPLEDSVKSEEENVTMSRKILRIMLRNARRLQRLINQLLDISKLESGKMQLRLVRGDLAEIVRVIAGSFISLAESQKIKYQVQVDISERELCFDSDKLEKVITNLLSNAFKFTPKGGRVSLTMNLDSGDEKTGSLQSVLTVADTGRGIPKEQLDRIFDRFYQVSDSDTRDVEGSGIGLALTKELVELMHGSIEVESNPGEGTKFMIKFPVSEECFTGQELAEIESGVEIREEWGEVPEEEYEHGYVEGFENGQEELEQKEKELILIVEDNPDLRNYIRDQFNSEYRIIEAENGQTGYEKAVQHIPDLIITDLMMPVMGGMELCQKVKKHPATSHIPVIMLTAKADKESKLEGLEAMADDYIIKPFDSEVLAVRVKNLIRQRKELRKHFERNFLLEENGMRESPNSDGLLKEILEVFNRHLSDEDFRLSQLGIELHMSRSQVFRKVNAVTGTTPNEFLKLARMKEAARLLKQDNLNITQVMYQVGMKNPSHFAQTFKKFFGVNPSDYRRGR